MAEFARGFRLYVRPGQVLDGAMFPSGRCLVIDDPHFGLASAAASEEDLLRGYPDARIEWPGPAENCSARSIDRPASDCIRPARHAGDHTDAGGWHWTADRTSPPTP